MGATIRCGMARRTSALMARPIHVVGSRHPAGGEDDDQQERRHGEADDDRGEHERLGYGIGVVGRSGVTPSTRIGSLSIARPPMLKMNRFTA